MNDERGQHICVTSFTDVPLRVFVWLKLWPLHDEKSGKDVNEDPLDPGRHLVGLRGAKVDV